MHWRPEISFSELHFESSFQAYPTCQVLVMCRVPGAGIWHLNFQVPGALCKVTGKALKMQFRNAYFRLLVHPSRKLWPKPNSGNSVPCILPCKICGSWNLMKDLYLSTASFLTIVYLSKCNKNLLLSQKRHHIGYKFHNSEKLQES